MKSLKRIVLGTFILFVSSGLMAEGKAAAKKPASPAAKKAGEPAAKKPAEHEAAKPADAVAKKPAEAPAPAAAGAAKYGMAGCGLGSLVIHNDHVGPQIGAFFLNMTGVQTSGITSGTSNCVDGRSDVAMMEQEVYVTANLSSLSKEAAQGSGEHLDALAEVFGCKQVADKARLGQLSQSRYAELFSKQEAASVLNRYLAVVNADPLLAHSCSKAS